MATNDTFRERNATKTFNVDDKRLGDVVANVKKEPQQELQEDDPDQHRGIQGSISAKSHNSSFIDSVIEERDKQDAINKEQKELEALMNAEIEAFNNEDNTQPIAPQVAPTDLDILDSTIRGDLVNRELSKPLPTKTFTLGGDFPWGRVVNGYEITGTSVSIIDPEIQIGDSTPVATATQSRTITADYQYVGLQFDWDAWSVSVTTPSLTKPTSDDDYLRKWLYQFRYTAGSSGSPASVSIHRINNIGGLLIPAAFGDAP